MSATIFRFKKEGNYQWGKRMPYKEAMRRLVLVDHIPGSLHSPLRLITFPGENFSTERLLEAHGLPIGEVLGLETVRRIYRRMQKKKGLSRYLKSKIKVINASDRTIFQFEKSLARRKIGIAEGKNGFWLDYVCAFSEGVNYSLGQLALNKSLLAPQLKSQGSVLLHIAVRAADPTERGAALRFVTANADAYPELCANPPLSEVPAKDQKTLETYYKRAAGISIQICRTFNAQGYQIKNTHCFYYRNAENSKNGGTTMLFLGFKITYAGSRKTTLLPTEEPVFLGIEKYQALPHTAKTTKMLRALGILAFSPEEDARFEKYVAGARAWASQDLSLAAENLPTKGGKQQPSLTAKTLAATINALHKKTRITQKELEEIVAKTIPNGKALGKTNIRSGASKLKNLIAMAKKALTQGGYQLPAQKDGIVLTPRGIALCRKKFTPHESLIGLTIEGAL